MDMCKPTPVNQKFNSVPIALNLVQVMGINNSVWVSHMHNYNYDIINGVAKAKSVNELILWMS